MQNIKVKKIIAMILKGKFLIISLLPPNMSFIIFMEDKFKYNPIFKETIP